MMDRQLGSCVEVSRAKSVKELDEMLVETTKEENMTEDLRLR